MPSHSPKPDDSRDSAVQPAPEPSKKSVPGTGMDSEHKGAARKKEIGGRKGPDPTRYGDWEKDGRCVDF